MNEPLCVSRYQLKKELRVRKEATLLFIPKQTKMLKKGAVLVIQYRYPCENTPRTTSVRYTSPSSILDAVAVAISKDANLAGIFTSENPTIALSNLLLTELKNDERGPHIRDAMTYASIQPPPYRLEEKDQAPKRRLDTDEEGRFRKRPKTTRTHT